MENAETITKKEETNNTWKKRTCHHCDSSDKFNVKMERGEVSTIIFFVTCNKCNKLVAKVGVTGYQIHVMSKNDAAGDVLCKKCDWTRMFVEYNSRWTRVLEIKIKCVKCGNLVVYFTVGDWQWEKQG